MADRSEVSREDHEFKCTGCEAWFPHAEGREDDDGAMWCYECYAAEEDAYQRMLDEDVGDPRKESGP